MLKRRREEKRRRWAAQAADEPMEPRQLTRLEYAILFHLLSRVDFPQVQQFRDQLPYATVVGMCGCGCETIYLDVDLNQADRASSSAWDEPAILLETDDPWLMVMQCDGVLTCLEYVPHGDDDSYRIADVTLDGVARLRPELRIEPEQLAAIE